MGDLEGLTSIVTGGARGIGAGIVEVISKEGARVVIADIDEDGARAMAKLVTDGGGEAIGLAHDVTSEASCREVVARAVQAFGSIDVLVNNAGVTQRIPFGDMEEAAWDRVIDVNLKGVYLMSRAVLGSMIERRSGSIVNIASIVGKAGSHPLFSHYVASKFGVVGLTQALAGELAQYGIRVNAVCPGVVRTSMQEQGLSETAAERGLSMEDVWKELVAAIPLGRPQLPEDIGMAVAFLASTRACNITGESINVNGGQLMD